VLGAAIVAEPLVGRDAISTPLAGNPVNVDVPPGRYCPAGAAMRTVAADGGVAAAELTLVEAAGDDEGMDPYLSGSALGPTLLALAAGATDAAGDAGTPAA
jgi:hypothetical protein